MRRILFLLLILVSCAKTWQPAHVENLVVEGWIESDGYPLVMLTTSVATDTDIQSVDSLESHLLRWAKVTVSDGDTTIVLTGRHNRKYFPPYIYSTTRMIGKPGKTYYLTVDYASFHATASTTVPQPRELDALRAERIEGSDTLYNLTARFTDPRDSKDYYKFFLRVQGKDSTFVPAFLGNVDDAVLDGPAAIPLHRGSSIRNRSLVQPFVDGERVTVRFCTLDENAFRFWKEFEEMSALSTSPVFQTSFNPPSNVKGALGYWAGYGVRDYTLTIGATTHQD